MNEDGESDLQLFHGGVLALLAELEQALQARGAQLPVDALQALAMRLDALTIQTQRMADQA